MRKALSALAAAFLLLVPVLSHAWWNQDWTARKKITLDVAAAGLSGSAANVPVLVRLHTGNFPFAEAQLDGEDLRFVGPDDTTPLKFHVERFDGINELALVWVQVPRLDAAAGENYVWLYYGNDKAVPGADAKATYDASQTLVLHFAEKDGVFRDATAYGHDPVVSGVTVQPAGLADAAAVFDGDARLGWSATPGLAVSANGFTFSAWVKAADGSHSGTLYAQQAGGAAVEVLYDQGKVVARAFGVETGRADLTPGAWQHVAVTLSDRLVLYVDGREAASADVKAADLSGDVVVGAGFRGQLDEVQLSSVARPPAWLATQALSQGEGARLVSVAAEGESEGGEGVSYFRILLSAVTLDGWIVIVILMIMMVISFIVMIGKGIFLSRTDGANQKFLRSFAALPGGDLMALEGQSDKGLTSSSLMRIYRTAIAELHKRFDVTGRKGGLSAQSIDAIRASLDADVVRERARLDSQMVLLTIAISGGPFLGLLGTVVGVMITFAAIAAVGDVNVNSIAPGIAAALVATVAGLGVAIPALFGYNYLASRVKNISADMQVFVDELISKIAENYSN
jgi:biopolymer transport protein ExbB